MATTETVLIDKLLHTVVRQGASDLHITVGQPPVIRLDGHMVKLKTKVLEPDDTMALMKSITPERCQQELQEVGGSDFGFAFGELARFRVSIFKQRGNVAMVLRQIPDQAADHRAAGPAARLACELIQRPRGLFLVTGPTGSGKTTTLASMINYLNENFDHHIITIEDPIEFYHPHKKSTVNQREIGVDVPSFAEAMRRALRQDPDVILVGEMRDLETIEAAITRGRNRPRRVRHAAHHRRPGHGQPHHRRLSDQPAGADPHAACPRRSSACSRRRCCPRSAAAACAAYEMLVVNSAIANLIRENKTFRITSAIQTGAKQGMQLLDDSLFKLWKRAEVRQGRRHGQGPDARRAGRPHRQCRARHVRRGRRRQETGRKDDH